MQTQVTLSAEAKKMKRKLVQLDKKLVQAIAERAALMETISTETGIQPQNWDMLTNEIKAKLPEWSEAAGIELDRVKMVMTSVWLATNDWKAE